MAVSVHVFCALVGLPIIMGQLAGDMIEMPPPVDVAHCSRSTGCHFEKLHATMDGNWRWVHGEQCVGSGASRQCYSSGNCYTNGMWDKTQCPDPKACAENCALEAITAEQYANIYGVSVIKGGLKLKFVTGANVGSRLYLLEPNGKKYKLFKLKNREFTFDVDASALTCGMNGAVYFSEMEASGGLGGRNKAGAKFGTGYCDAQCPHDVKFIDGEANILEWNSTTTFGKYGACCAEMDIWEANKHSTAYTTHICSKPGVEKCSGIRCGGLPTELKYRYKGTCDKDGCDFNSYRNGDKAFIGPGSKYEVDTRKPVTVVTQWVTSDGTDDGDLVEIRRLYVQGDRVIHNSRSDILSGRDKEHSSISDAYCAAQKKAFADPDEQKKKGGLKVMGEAVERGMVLVLSLWDDTLTRMLWLDSYTKNNKTRVGNYRGPCDTSSGVPSQLRGTHGDAFVTYTNFMYGEINSTYTAGKSSKPEAAPQRQWPPQSKQVLSVSGSGAPAVQMSGPASKNPDGAFAQCGGKEWTGTTECKGHCKCVKNGDYYSQCVPPKGSYSCSSSRGFSQKDAVPSAKTLKPLWQQDNYGICAMYVSFIITFSVVSIVVGPLLRKLWREGQSVHGFLPVQD